MYEENVVKAGQMSGTARKNLVALIPETADYLANTEIDRVSLILIIESVLGAWRERLDCFDCAHLSLPTRTAIAEAIDNARKLLTERRYDALVDELYYIDVMLEGNEVVEIDDPCTEAEFERELMITPIDQVLTYLVCMNDFEGYMPIDGESPADYVRRLDFEEYPEELIRRIDMGGLVIIQEPSESHVVDTGCVDETQVSKRRENDQIPETDQVDEVI